MPLKNTEILIHFIIRNKKEEKEKEKYFPYANKEIPFIPFKSKPVTVKDYYTYPEFSLMPRINHTIFYNFSEGLTLLIKIFSQFFTREQVKGFVIVINKYAV
jgi:hypothetical protein